MSVLAEGAQRETWLAVAGLAEAVLSLRPLVDVLDPPVRIVLPVSPGRHGRLGPAEVLATVAERAGAGGLELCPGLPERELRVFERVARDRLAPLNWPALAQVPGHARDELCRITDKVVTSSFDRYRTRPDVRAPDGVPLRVYAAGSRQEPAVVIVTACGMPAKLCERWVRALSQDHLVITWESRGLFGEVEDFDALSYDAVTQAGDLIAALDRYRVPRAHVMGFCTGSVIALAAAAASPDRVGSVSLWHGAYELGPDGPKTGHHRHMQALMAMAARSREAARSAHSVFCQSMLGRTPPDTAHLVLYPYATPELLYRYCRVNGTITDTDVTGFLPAVSQPALVVTSEDDDTADPRASEAVAARLPDATLQVEPHGDHISLFKAGHRLEQLAARFIRAAQV